MIPETGAVLAGVCIGTGIALTARGLVPARPDLTRALNRLHAPPTHALTPPATLPGRHSRWRAEIGGWLDAHTPARWTRTPNSDLVVLGWTRQHLLLQKLTAFLIGLALPTVVFTVVVFAGFHLTVAVPAAITLAVGIGMSLIPDLAARGQAVEARMEFRRAVGAYFDLVALERAAEGGPVDALTRAASIARGWAFTRIADTLTQARLTGAAPWDALADLAEQVGVTELTDLADVVTLAGNDGAAIYETLLAKARSIRAAALASTEATANARSETMTLPAALLGIGFVILVGYPALARIIGGS